MIQLSIPIYNKWVLHLLNLLHRPNLHPILKMKVLIHSNPHPHLPIHPEMSRIKTMKVKMETRRETEQRERKLEGIGRRIKKMKTPIPAVHLISFLSFRLIWGKI